MNKVTKVLKKVAGLIKKEAEPSKKEILKKILYAKSVAIIGASEKESSVGCEITKNILESFKGNVFPVNPKYETILGQKAYKSVLDIKKTVDFAVIVVPAKAVLGVVEECAKAKISGVVVISAGFKEIGQEGALLEKQLLDIVNTNKMALIGPNCLGVLNLHNNLNASFSPVAPKKAGKVAFVSQSGALVCGIINLMEQENLNCSQIVSIGNQTDVDFLDLFELWEDDDNIEIILAYRFKKINR